MKFYLLDEPDDDTSTEFSHIGTWKEFREYCDSCKLNNEKLTSPLQIEWEPYSDKIGDFSWCGYTIIVLDQVKNFLIKNLFECKFETVEVCKPTTKSKKRKTVPFPYEKCSDEQN